MKTIKAKTLARHIAASVAGSSANWGAFAAAILLSVGIAAGNPIPGPVGVRVYISSERLEVKVSPSEAVFRATFIFSAQDLKNANLDMQETFMQLPIWFPQQPSGALSVSAFWKTFGTNMAPEGC